MNLKKIELEPAIDLDGSTSEPAIRSGDTGQRIPCFDSCQLITTLMSNMCALSVFLFKQNLLVSQANEIQIVAGKTLLATPG